MKRLSAQLVALLLTSLAVLALAVPGSHSQAPQQGAAPPGGESAPGTFKAAEDTSYRESDSPVLRLPADKLDLPPILPPDPLSAADLRTEAASPQGVVVYDAATEETTVLAGPVAQPQALGSGSYSTPPFDGLAPSPGALESVFDPDGRQRVTDTAAYPWRTVAKLLVTFPGGSGWCTGAIIGCGTTGFHVLSAGHCVHSTSYGGWATAIEVYPGLDEASLPYNYAYGTEWLAPQEWVNSQDGRYDWALVTLDRSVGSYTGWMGRITADPSSGIYTGPLTTAGYPSDRLPDGSMWWGSEPGRTANDFNHWYYMDTASGQSGAPVWRVEPGTGNRHILTVHTTGDDGSSSNHGTRLNLDMFNQIQTWCEADPLPEDKADLIDDGQAYSGFSPSTVDPGVTPFTVYNDVRNVGTAPSGDMNVEYYASTNTTITRFDHLIGTTRLNSIAPFSWRDAEWSGVFDEDPSIPDGTYWVGWIIDADSEVTEFDKDNNTSHKSTYQLVVCDRPSAPVLDLPVDGNSACEDRPVFDWDPTPGADSYRIEIDDDPAFGSPLIETTVVGASFYQPLGSLPDGTYAWHVAASNTECGQGPWSEAWTYTNRVISTPPPLVSPADGSFTCQSRGFLHWQPNPVATSYDMQVDDETSFGAPIEIEAGTTRPYYAVGGQLGLDTYYWRARARNECGQDGPWASYSTVEIIDCDPMFFPIMFTDQ